MRTKGSGVSDGPISEALRRAIRDSGASLYAIATAAGGVDVGTLGRFVRGECGLKLATVDLLFVVLGLRMVRGGDGTADPGPAGPTDALRAAIEGSGFTAPKVSALSGVHAQAIRNFIGRVLGLELVSADRIAAAMGLCIVQGPRPTLAPPERPGDAGRPILDAILAEIEAQGTNLAELARISGVRRDHLDRLVVRDGNAKIATVDRLCEALGIGFAGNAGEPPAVPSLAILRGIEASGLSARRISQLSGVVYQSIQGFRGGTLGLELVSAEKLVAALGLVAARGQVARPPDPPALINPSIPYLDGLRAKVKGTGLSVYALSRISRLAQPPIARFLKGENNLTTTSIAKLAAAVDFDPGQESGGPAPTEAAGPWGGWDRDVCPVHVREDGHLVVFGRPKKQLRSGARIKLASELAKRYPAGGFDLPGLKKRFGSGARQAFYCLKRIDADCDAAFQPAGVDKGSLYRIGPPAIATTNVRSL